MLGEILLEFKGAEPMKMDKYLNFKLGRSPEIMRPILGKLNAY